MTVKQKLFIKKYIEYKGNASKAALAVYDVKPSAARQVGYEILTKPYIKKEIERLLEPKELKLSVYLEKLSTIAQANPPKGYTGGDVLKAIEIVLKLHGVLVDRKQVASYMVTTDLNKLNKQELLDLRSNKLKETESILENENTRPRYTPPLNIEK
jgi:hypothetical protein